MISAKKNVICRFDNMKSINYCFLKLYVLCGVLLSCCNNVYSHSIEYNNILQDRDEFQAAVHVKEYDKHLRNIPKHLLQKLDTSCEKVNIPLIEHGRVLDVRKAVIKDGKHKKKQYKLAEFQCDSGYRFKHNSSERMFCSKGKWIGKKPKCEKIDGVELANSNFIDSTTNLSKECPVEYKKKCKHLCYILNGAPTCGCPPGFLEKENKCEDINECESNNGGCQHFCHNNLGSYSCSCPQGYRLSTDRKSCEDINECHLRNGHGPCQDTCENTPGSYKCGCSNMNGTRLASDLHTCADVNECTEGISGCSHSCINAHGRAFCTCPEGMELMSDWKTCKDINECEDLGIKLSCKYGCINFIGSYICAQHPEETLSDEPIEDNSTLPREYDEYEDENYDEEEYDENGDYEEEDYDENDKISSTTKKPVENIQRPNEKKESSVYDDDDDDYDEDEYDEEYDEEKEKTEGNTDSKKEVTTTEIRKAHNDNILRTNETVKDINRRIDQDSDKDDGTNEDEYDDDEYEDEYDNEINKAPDVNLDVNSENGKELENNLITNKIDNIDSFKETTIKTDNLEEVTVKGENKIEEAIEETNKNENQLIKVPKPTNTSETAEAETRPTPTESAVVSLVTSIENTDNFVNFENVTINHPVINETNDETNEYVDYDEEDEIHKPPVEDITPTPDQSVAIGRNVTNEERMDKNLSEETNKISHKEDEYDEDEYDENEYDEKETSRNKTVGISQIRETDDNISKNVTVTSPSTDISPSNVVTNQTVNLSNTSNNTDDENYDENYEDNYEENYDEETENKSTSTTVEPPKESMMTSETVVGIYSITSRTNNIGEISTTTISSISPKVVSGNETNGENYEENYDDNYEEEEENEITVTSARPHQEVMMTSETIAGHFNVTTTRNTVETTTEQKTDEYDYDDEYKEEDYDGRNELAKTSSSSSTKSPEDIIVTSETNVRVFNVTPRMDEMETTTNFTTTMLTSNNNELNASMSTTSAKPIEELPVTHGATEGTFNMSSRMDHVETTTPCTSSTQKSNDYDYGDDYKEEDYEEVGKPNEKLKSEGNCEAGFQTDGEGRCQDIDECLPETNPCSNDCQNTIGSFICICPSGHRLSAVDPLTCQDIDECLDKPCSHSCINLEGSFRCECPEGLTLQNTTCLNLTCSHGQTRVNGILRCTCPPGYTLGEDERTCEDIDECLLGSDCSHRCRNTQGSYECSCESGFRLENQKTCVDIDECSGSQHNCSQVCENTPGSYRCACEDGYEFNNRTNDCVDINECDPERDLDECNQICVNYDGGYECGCFPGYQMGSDDATCQDVNECLSNNGNCSQNCNNIAGSYQCGCENYYRLEDDKHSCRLMNLCLENNGGCSHECVYENGATSCKCPDGYILEDKECFLQDPCLINNGGCSHICVNANGAARCECPAGYELNNKTTCGQLNPCTMNNGNCSHFCEFVDGLVNCLCPELHILQNGTHCVEINPCLENNGGCSHICNFVDHMQSCTCPETHELRNQTHCMEKNLCLVDNGGCSDICEFNNGTVSCSCPEKYYLQGKTCYRIDYCLTDNGGCSHDCFMDDFGNILCTCPPDFELQPNNKTCVPKDPCLINNGNCSHICDSTKGAKLCYCPEGFRLKNITHCEGFDPCSEENGGCSDYCENVRGKPKCSCPEFYVLKDETSCVLENPCLENNGGCSHKCEMIDDEVECSCPDHFNLINKTTCVQVNPCFVNNGGCSHECTSENNEVFCLCPEGYKLEGKTCMLVNPCDVKNGGCTHICSVVNQQVVCRCPPGYELMDKTCFKINPCLVNNGGCSHTCTNAQGQARCSCPPGYKLFGKRCLDEDPCAKNNGGCSHYCHNRDGKRECSCPPGYLLRPNNKICKEINECKVKRGGCSHGCKNLPGSFECTCPVGFMLEPSNNRTCVDIDECANNNGDCQMQCRNFIGGYRCECDEGFRLQKDKHSCRTAPSANLVQCRIPRSPSNSVMRCSSDHSEPGELVPMGTRCDVYCNEGFKLMGLSQRFCNRAGIWDNDEPRCVVSSCPALPQIRNGWYLPSICNSGKVYPGEVCEVNCRKGFVPRREIARYICTDNMQWMPPVQSEVPSDMCMRSFQEAYIRCPHNGHMEFILPPGHRDMYVKIPKPDTNVDWNNFVTSEPSWGARLQATLPVGRAEVKFTAFSPNINSTASCNLVIDVLDREQPKVIGCPENMERTLGRGENMQIVYWREPMFQDNIGVRNVYKSREPGSGFGHGLHRITYVATDESGNRAFCQFTINVKDDLDLVESNSIQQLPTFTNHHTAGRYKAVLICPSGIQYMSQTPDNYNNMITKEAGCYWRHVKLPRPIQPQNYRVQNFKLSGSMSATIQNSGPPKVFSESRLPKATKSNRRVYFKWDR